MLALPIGGLEGSGGRRAESCRDLVYAKILVPGPHPIPALMATTDEADVLVPQLLERGWVRFGDALKPEDGGR